LALPVHREGHAARLLHLLGGVQQLDGEEVASLVRVEDHPRLVLVALGHLALAKRDGQGVAYAVVLDLDGTLQELISLLVLYTVTTWMS
jgi:hypothetical protein